MTIRLDPYAIVYPKYISPGVFEATGGVFRGFPTEDAARTYAYRVLSFFMQNALTQPVYVVRGPTSTTRMPYEVVDACCGYTVVLKLEPKYGSGPAQ